MADVDIFRDEFLPNIETHARIDYTRWKAQNPNEAIAFESYRDKVLAGQAATPPNLATKYGKALVAAAKMAHETATPPPPSGAPNISGVTDPVVQEGGIAVFAISLTGPSLASTYRLTVVPGTAVSSDVGAVTYSDDGQVTWKALQNGVATIRQGVTVFHARVQAIADSLAEGNETFTLNVEPVSDAGTVTGHGIGTITEGAAPPPPPDPGDWPATYTNGPLGDRNFLPPKGKVWLSIFPGTIGYDWTMQRNYIASQEAKIGRRYDIVVFANPPGVWGEDRIVWATNNGYIPYIAGYHFGMSVDAVAAGQADGQINQLADHLKTKPKHMLRLFSEFDMPHVGYTSQGKEQAFVNAWKRVVDIFDARGATNTGFFLCPTEGAGRATATQVLNLMPNEYFDWVGVDAYNFQRVGSGGYSTPMHAGWAEFWELVQYPPGVSGTVSYSNRHDAWGPRKPFVIGEVNTIYDPNAPTKRADWFRNVLTAAKGLRQMEHCVGVTWYDADVSAAEGPDNNFLIDSRGNAIAGFVDMARDSIWLCRGN